MGWEQCSHMATQTHPDGWASPEDIREVIDMIQARPLATHWQDSEERRILLRELAGLSQEALGERLGVHRSTISRWETGKRDSTDRRYRSVMLELEADHLERMELGLWLAKLSDEEREVFREQLVAEASAT